MRYRILNWSEYQHYKDRCPPWIKLHHALLTSEVWVMGDDASRALTVACMLLAARNNDMDGSFNGDPEYIKRFAYLTGMPDFKPLIKYGFIEVLQDDSKVLAKCNTEQSRDRAETEQSKADSVKVDDEFDRFWKSYPKKTGKAEALKSWKKHKPDLNAVLSALGWQTKSHAWNKDGGQYIPNPATYLNQGRWQDEPAGDFQKRRVPESENFGERNYGEGVTFL